MRLYMLRLNEISTVPNFFCREAYLLSSFEGKGIKFVGDGAFMWCLDMVTLRVPALVRLSGLFGYRCYKLTHADFSSVSSASQMAFLQFGDLLPKEVKACIW